jgi:hypothetical protein
MSVFLINGFLEAGKTKFLKFTLGQDYFQTSGTTLLLLCEEGEEEYPPELLQKTRTVCETIDSPEQLNPGHLTDLQLMHDPERIIIEWNGMWDPGLLHMPDAWSLHQQITIIDGSTLDVYLKNMKPLLGKMLLATEMSIVNRCDGIEDLDQYRLTLRAMNRDCQFVFEDKDGEITGIPEMDLPYDLSAEVLDIQPSAYGVWYFDCMDRRDRYEGKVVEYTAMVLKRPTFPKNYFVPGRMAMTCCADDMTFVGFACKAREARHLETRQWVRLRGRIAYEYWPDYGEEGPVIHAEWVKDAQPIKEPVTF